MEILEADAWPSILPHPSASIITGGRGKGKSALGYYLLEHLSELNGIDPHVAGFPREKWGLLPSNFKRVGEGIEDLEALAEDSMVFFDEASLRFYARRFRRRENELMDWLVSLSRQRGQTIMFATHHTRKLDINLITDADAVLFKQPSRFHAKLERPEIRELAREAQEAFSQVGNPLEYTYVVSADYDGALVKNPLPSFWSDEISRGWAELPPPFIGRPDFKYAEDLRKILRFEDEHPEKNEMAKLVPWAKVAWQWFEVGVSPGRLNQLVTEGILGIVYKSATSTYYAVKDRELAESMI